MCPTGVNNVKDPQKSLKFEEVKSSSMRDGLIDRNSTKIIVEKYEKDKNPQYECNS